MSVNYARPLPRDRRDGVWTNSAVPTSTLGSFNIENTTASSVTSLSDLATVVEVTAVGVGVAIRWAVNQATSVITAAGTANFDNVVPVSTTRTFVIPRLTQAVASVAGINVQEGLFANIATKTVAGAGSVLLAQY